MTDLTNLRDELAHDYALLRWGSQTETADFIRCEFDFKAGFDAAIQALTEEFDEKAALKKFRSINVELNYEESHVAMARWQFEQDRARIGLAERNDKDWEYEHGNLYKENRELEARLAESERELSEYSRITTNYRDKLTAAEARVKELEVIMTKVSEIAVCDKIAEEALNGLSKVEEVDG